MNEFLDRTRRIAVAHNGHIDKPFGDGFLATFDRPTDAVDFAIELQESVHTNPLSAAHRQLMRIALHVDDVVVAEVEYGRELFGEGIKLAARFQEQAAPGEMLVSERAYRELPRDYAALFKERRRVTLKRSPGLATVYIMRRDS